jgi:dihydrofolate reductase
MAQVPYNIIVGGCVVPNNPQILGIGTNRSMLWNFREDMEYFRNNTMGHIVLMGYTTWCSIPERFRPLPKRINVVISSKADELNVQKTVYQTRTETSGITGLKVAHDHIHFVPSLEDAWNFIALLKGLEEHRHKIVWVMGGGSIYRQVLETRSNDLQELHLTKIYTPYPCDTFFPLAQAEKLLTCIAEGLPLEAVNTVRMGLPIKYQINIYKKIDTSNIPVTHDK